MGLLLIFGINSVNDIFNIITAAGAIGAAIAAAIYTFKSRGTKEMKETIKKIAENVANIEINFTSTKNDLEEIKKSVVKLDTSNTTDHNKLFDNIRTTTKVVSDLIEKADIDKAIDNVLINAEGFINNDYKITAFFELSAALVKQMITEIIKTGISNMTKAELKAKVDYARYEIREYYNQFENDFLITIRPKLVELIEKYQEDLYSIHDDVINDKNLRIKITSTLLLQHTFSYVIQERYKYVSTHPLDNQKQE
jgi:hypothetical protein